MTSEARPRILVVDDEEAILETMMFTFEDDYEVFTATDARRALDILDVLHVLGTVARRHRNRSPRRTDASPGE